MKKLVIIALLYASVCEAQTTPRPPTPQDLHCKCIKFKEHSVRVLPLPLAIVDCDNVRSLLSYENSKWDFVHFDRSTIIEDGIYVDSTDTNALLVKVNDLYFKRSMTYKFWKDRSTGKLMKGGIME